jgi:glutamate racemase
METALNDLRPEPHPRPTIGVFDSGFGGLTVLKALTEIVPTANYIYFGDTARLPYGSKSAEIVGRYAVEAAKCLESNGAQMLVIACNSATALALDRIIASTHVPVIGVVEPGARAAAKATKNRKVIVIGTEATVCSHAYLKALEVRGLRAREQSCPLLVPLVEEGWVDHSVTEQVAQIYLNEAFSDGFQEADTLVLGCTHYPLLKLVLQRIIPGHVTIVDSAASTACAVASQLGDLLPASAVTDVVRRAGPRLKFFATDSTEKFRRLGQRFLGHPIDEVMHADLE